MSDSTPFNFGKFVPGFDFLQNLTKGAANNSAQMPSLSSWIAPTMSVEDVEKRIKELKSVQFWLEQNSRALTATIQALEVQKMTLSTLEGMNVSMSDVANAFKLNTPDSVMGNMQKMSESFVGAAQSMAGAAGPTRVPDMPTPPPAVPPAATAEPSSESKLPTSTVDPMQWWGALTQQFQQIAGTVLADVAKQTAFEAAQGAATDMAKGALKTATGIAAQSVQNVQKATLAATKLATLPMSPPMPTGKAAAAAAAAKAPVVKKTTTAAKNTTAAKDPVAKKPAATKAAAPKAAAPRKTAR